MVQDSFHIPFILCLMDYVGEPNSVEISLSPLQFDKIPRSKLSQRRYSPSKALPTSANDKWRRTPTLELSI